MVCEGAGLGSSRDLDLSPKSESTGQDAAPQMCGRDISLTLLEPTGGILDLTGFLFWHGASDFCPGMSASYTLNALAFLSGRFQDTEIPRW